MTIKWKWNDETIDKILSQNRKMQGAPQKYRARQKKGGQQRLRTETTIIPLCVRMLFEVKETNGLI